jgi:hypothetical protein
MNKYSLCYIQPVSSRKMLGTVSPITVENRVALAELRAQISGHLSKQKDPACLRGRLCLYMRMDDFK